MGVQAMKHAAMLQEWSVKIADCRSSDQTVKDWCAERGINVKQYYYWEKQLVTEATKQLTPPAPYEGGQLMRISPDKLPDSAVGAIGPGITIRHGESMISLPAGSSAEAVAELVKALNRHA